jgi:protein-S-isoprenylcysteine O-methyltransferase Ste14
MLWFYEGFFPALWTIFLVWWQIRANHTKSTQRIEPMLTRILRVLTFVVVIILLCAPNLPIPWLDLPVGPGGLLDFWIGAAVNIAGLLFAVWAREHLGRNWSRAVTIKQDHELITSGPYALVRHPIYTGILTGFLGSAIALSQVRGYLAFVLIFCSFWAKLRLEEKWMRSQFGDTYAAYVHQTSALVPYLF